MQYRHRRVCVGFGRLSARLVRRSIGGKDCGRETCEGEGATKHENADSCASLRGDVLSLRVGYSAQAIDRDRIFLMLIFDQLF
jgi:hypothetical protein